MKKSLLALLLGDALCSAAPAQAQTVWAPTGAEWWYSLSTIGGPGYVHAWADSSLTVQGRPARRIRAQQYMRVMGTTQYVASLPGQCITVQQGNTVLTWNGTTLAPLFDFSRQLGDSWTMVATVPCVGVTDTARITIDSTGTTLYGNRSLSFWRLRSQQRVFGQPFVEFTGTVIERLGYPYAVIVPSLECGTCPDSYQLVSYNDADVTFGTRPNFQVMAVPKELALAAASISPNPATDGRYRLTNSAALDFAVLDAQGRCINQGKLAPGDGQLDLSAQPTGLYVLRLTDAAGHSVSRRLVRQ